MITEASTLEHRALAYMASRIHDKRISREVKEEIAAVLLPCLYLMVGDPEG